MMNKFSIGLCVLAGVAGVVIYNRYRAARYAAKELELYDELDAGYIEEESR